MRNLEAKFPLTDLTAARAQLEALGFVEREHLVQRDTFFVTRRGKLKLREQPNGAWLIHYQRAHQGALELSDYTIIEVAAPAALRAMLSAAFGVRAEIHKSRLLMMRDNIRAHLDMVTNLGQFGEIELVLAQGADASSHASVIEEILETLGIKSPELIEQSYFEMLTARSEA
jgi:predicted adenylyl cyclase CyaB